MRSQSARGRIRRAVATICYWLDEQLVFENFLTARKITAHPSTADVLHFFQDWRAIEEFYAHMPGYERASLRNAVDALIENSLLVREHSPQARQDEFFRKKWQDWLPSAGAFHFGTKDVRYGSPRDLQAHLRYLFKDSPQPGFFKNYKRAARLKLPEPRAPSAEFLQVLARRRTHRRFSAMPLSQSNLAELLYYTWGVTGYIHEPTLGALPVKTSPSGGSRHPGEVYVLALRVAGLAPGLYHYSPNRHLLTRLRLGQLRGKAGEYCAGQSWCNKAAALFIMTAVFSRSMWKYRTPRAYRVVLADAGHLCQNFCLVATWLGLAPFCTMALKDSLIEKDLGIDGVTESVLYVAGVGAPASRAGTAPVTFERRIASG